MANHFVTPEKFSRGLLENARRLVREKYPDLSDAEAEQKMAELLDFALFPLAYSPK